MAYRLRLYAPAGAGITSLTVRSSGGSLLGTGYPAGTGTACFDQSNLTTGVTITPALESGVSVDQWVINVDGAVYYQYTTACSIGYDSSASNVQVRLEVSGSASTTYSAALQFNANGGSGAPSSVSNTGDSQYVSITIPYTQPTRTGYTFLGWSLDASASAASYYPGSTYAWYGTTYGYTHTLYAVWADSGGGAYIYTGAGWQRAAPYVCTSQGWQKSSPYIYTSQGWRKGT